MYKRVINYIEKNSMFEGIKNVVVGFSGGADSVCLLSLLKRYIQCDSKNGGQTIDNEFGNDGDDKTIRLIAVHIHHGIRGAEADYDEAFCEKFCKDIGVEYRCFYYDIPALAAESGMSEEQQGRLCRYEAFTKVINENRATRDKESMDSVIAVAHHENDQAETMIHNLVRGTGLKGMTAMSPKTFRNDIGCMVIRPLLCVRRAEIEEYLRENSLNYCTDSTNLADDYTRNKIRHNIIDYMSQEINSSAVENICRFGDKLRLLEEYMDLQVTSLMSQYVLNKAADDIFISQDLFARHISISGECIYRILAGLLGKDMEEVHVDSILSLASLQTGRRISLPKKYEAKKRYDGVEIYHIDTDFHKVLHDNMGVCKLGGKGSDLQSRGKIGTGVDDISSSVIKILDREEFEAEFAEKKFNDIYTKYFDYDKIIKYASGFSGVADIEERHRMAGDYFVCDREGHRKKLKSYLVDEKVPEEQRDRLKLFAIGSHILWIAGMRDTAAFLVDEGTRKILRIQLRA